MKIRHKIRVFFILLFVLSFHLNIRAQFLDAGASLVMAFPQGEFKNFLNTVGGGFSGFVLYHPSPATPFSVGLNINYIMYGSETRKEPWSNTIPDAYLTVERSNNILQFHGIFQVSPFQGDIRPYIEGLFGGAYFWTSTSVKSDYQDKELTNSVNQSDWAWSYGAGGGFLVRLYSGINDNGSDYSIFLDLKGRYLYGTKAEYLKEGDVKIQNGKITMFPSKSETDLMFVHLGVTATFSTIK